MNCSMHTNLQSKAASVTVVLCVLFLLVFCKLLVTDLKFRWKSTIPCHRDSIFVDWQAGSSSNGKNLDGEVHRHRGNANPKSTTKKKWMKWKRIKGLAPKSIWHFNLFIWVRGGLVDYKQPGWLAGWRENMLCCVVSHRIYFMYKKYVIPTLFITIRRLYPSSSAIHLLLCGTCCLFLTRFPSIVLFVRSSYLHPFHMSLVLLEVHLVCFKAYNGRVWFWFGFVCIKCT